MHVFLHAARDEDAAGLRDPFQASCHVDAVAPNVAAVDDDIAEVDADAELDALVLWDVGVAFEHTALDFDGAAHRVHDA